MTFNYGRAFSTLLPGAKWTCYGDDVYDNYVWQDDRPQPTEAECDALIPTLLANLERQQISDERRNAYQQESDPLFFAWQRGETSEQDWLNKVQEIKERFPHA